MGYSVEVERELLEVFAVDFIETNGCINRAYVTAYTQEEANDKLLSERQVKLLNS